MVVSRDGCLISKRVRRRWIAWDEAKVAFWFRQSMMINAGYIAREKGGRVRVAAFRTFSQTPRPRVPRFR